MADVIDELVGVAPGSTLDGVRARRAVARAQSEESYRVLFDPADPGEVSQAERLAIGVYCAGLHGEPASVAHYRDRLRTAAPAALGAAVDAAIAETLASGPMGSYPPGPLSREDTPAPRFVLSPATAAALGPRLAAALAHVHMLVFHPRDAAPAHFGPLIAAGWSTTAIVTLSQMVSFLAYQIRLVIGLRALATAGPA
jgi:CMD domain protein